MQVNVKVTLQFYLLLFNCTYYHSLASCSLHIIYLQYSKITPPFCSSFAVFLAHFFYRTISFWVTIYWLFKNSGEKLLKCFNDVLRPAPENNANQQQRRDLVVCECQGLTDSPSSAAQRTVLGPSAYKEEAWSRLGPMGPLLDPKVYPARVGTSPETDTMRFNQPNVFLQKVGWLIRAITKVYSMEKSLGYPKYFR